MATTAVVGTSTESASAEEGEDAAPYAEVAEVDVSQYRASHLIGMQLHDTSGDSYGIVTDVQLQPNGQPVAYHVTIGSTMGLGGTTFRVPIEAISISVNDENELVGKASSEAVAKLQTQTELLKEFNFAEDSSEEPASAADQDARSVEGPAGDIAEATQNQNEWARQIAQSSEEAAAKAADKKAVKRFRERLMQAIEATAAIDRDAMQDVEISLADGVVTLTGKVGSEAAKEALLKAARAAGRHAVIDALEVPDQTQVSAASD